MHLTLTTETPRFKAVLKFGPPADTPQWTTPPLNETLTVLPAFSLLCQQVERLEDHWASSDACPGETECEIQIPISLASGRELTLAVTAKLQSKDRQLADVFGRNVEVWVRALATRLSLPRLDAVAKIVWR